MGEIIGILNQDAIYGGAANKRFLSIIRFCSFFEWVRHFWNLFFSVYSISVFFCLYIRCLCVYFSIRLSVFFSFFYLFCFYSFLSFNPIFECTFPILSFCSSVFLSQFPSVLSHLLLFVRFTSSVDPVLKPVLNQFSSAWLRRKKTIMRLPTNDVTHSFKFPKGIKWMREGGKEGIKSNNIKIKAEREKIFTECATGFAIQISFSFFLHYEL